MMKREEVPFRKSQKRGKALVRMEEGLRRERYLCFWKTSS